ncbi:MAG TPA: 23S rRNA (guanosine(2251)-2'-O)-methyltransferase RlmB [Firmicutes bacterium]|nr:23S rRNA (guanosine(2251)-2'-O)-methyltransferase RlmB [Bacillota bacterium]
MLICGKNTVTETLRLSPHLIRKIYLIPGKESDIPAAFQDKVEFRRKDYFEAQFKRGHHQGFAAEIASPVLQDTGYLHEIMGPSAFFLLLDGIQDPMNLGSILRTAYGLKVDAVVLTAHGAAPLTPAVFSASSGYAAAIPLVIMKNPAHHIKELKKEGLWVVSAHMKGEAELGRDKMALPFPLLLCMGSEGSGIRHTFIKESDFSLRIPQREGFDSYNVSVAAALLMWELSRLR